MGNYEFVKLWTCVCGFIVEIVDLWICRIIDPVELWNFEFVDLWNCGLLGTVEL